MKVAFDLDGTLDRKPVRDLALALIAAGHEIHVLTGTFLEGGEWQDEQAKLDKLVRLGLAQNGEKKGQYKLPDNMRLMVLSAVDHEKFDRAYRLADLGLRKGAYLAEHEIDLMFDDSETYIEMMPKMCGAQLVQVIP